MRRRPAGRRWAAAIVIIAFADIVLLGSGVGQCVDYAPGTGLRSYCTSGPALGVAGSWVIGIASILAVAYCGCRLVRSRDGD